MANLRVTAALRNARLDGLKTAIDAGAGAGLIKIYTGTQPANADAALSGNTLLGTLTFTDPSAPAASGGVLTFSTITQDTAADATGTATWARITDSTGATVFDCDVGTSGATINLNTTSIVTGGPIQISSFTITDSAT
jgi:hypothetical protein